MREPLFRYWLPAGEPQLPCPLLSCRMITMEDAKASCLSLGFGHLRNKKNAPERAEAGKCGACLEQGLLRGARREGWSAVPKAKSHKHAHRTSSTVWLLSILSPILSAGWVAAFGGQERGEPRLDAVPAGGKRSGGRSQGQGRLRRRAPGSAGSSSSLYPCNCPSSGPYFKKQVTIS